MSFIVRMPGESDAGLLARRKRFFQDMPDEKIIGKPKQPPRRKTRRVFYPIGLALRMRKAWLQNNHLFRTGDCVVVLNHTAPDGSGHELYHIRSHDKPAVEAWVSWDYLAS